MYYVTNISNLLFLKINKFLKKGRNTITLSTLIFTSAVSLSLISFCFGIIARQTSKDLQFTKELTEEIKVETETINKKVENLRKSTDDSRKERFVKLYQNTTQPYSKYQNKVNHEYIENFVIEDNMAQIVFNAKEASYNIYCTINLLDKNGFLVASTGVYEDRIEHRERLIKKVSLHRWSTEKEPLYYFITERKIKHRLFGVELD